MALLPSGSLPGCTPPLRGLFVDRWGTLLERPAKGWVKTFAGVRFSPGAVDALFHASQAGWRVYLIGNEEQVAFGDMAEAQWKKLERDLLEHLRAHGVPIARCYACLDHPKGERPHARDSVFLLPNTGALYHAAQTDGIVLPESWVIGDSTFELVAGWRAGCRLAGVRTGLALGDGGLEVEPDVLGADLAAVLREVVQGRRSVRG